ncbi:hypothetical protein QO012_002625 [Methylobacterium aerolatum]|uniref:Uncharacterized protein n=1 Tax=Methylobacterium aerolatum TaxID=418708 RepID=A0ABU0I0J3_9HYPH|nr:hypothetical protein [Methylobacterium aerolatum]GJD34014.1 hypothetical protein FMGBMHLM_0910 [Methylobacterium aerolatum]
MPYRFHVKPKPCACRLTAAGTPLTKSETPPGV